MNVAELFAVVACVVPVLAIAALAAFQLWLSYRVTQRVASHAWRMMQANLALSKDPMASSLAIKQEDTAKAEAEAQATQNGNGAMTPERRLKMFHNG